ncbi:MAG: phospholipid carrier-dependent glycosyltransferase [Bacilli bacterium]|nr:phospholipid carrier-dependent glycosyltransferase [Bacilli bacterium]
MKKWGINMTLFKKINLDDKTKKINKKDIIIMGIMVLLYSILSFYRLGDFKVPTTYKKFKYNGDKEILTLKEEIFVEKMVFYTGNNLGLISIFSSTNQETYEEIDTVTLDHVFEWREIPINKNIKYLKIVANEELSTVGDVQLYGKNNKKLSFIEEKNNPLTDELHLVPKNISFLNSTYFDEVYYARSAYEYVHGINVYEWTHPPLGKLLIAIPIKLFGFSPFTFRLMGNLFGILLIPIMYILTKKIFKSRRWALLGALLMMFDNFHFAHTRIALVDGIQVTFILLSVLFMKNYIDLEKESSFKKKSINLLLSGFFIGCAISTKWNAAYVALGLAICFFRKLLKDYKINIFEMIKKNFSIQGFIKYLFILMIIPLLVSILVLFVISKKGMILFLFIYFCILLIYPIKKGINILRKESYLLKLFILCIISFIIIPFLIYIMCYLLFPKINYYNGIIDMTKMMYDYHSKLDATHPFSSSWYEWPIMHKPVWFYSSDIINNTRMTISDIGNPAIWWFGIISFIYLILSSILRKEENSRWILIFILSSYLPYIFVGRLMFMYHYFITLPFMMLGIVSFIKWLTEITNNNRIYYFYIGIVILFFILFYPIVSGLPVKEDYINSLKWMKTWYF